MLFAIGAELGQKPGGEFLPRGAVLAAREGRPLGARHKNGAQPVGSDGAGEDIARLGGGGLGEGERRQGGDRAGGEEDGSTSEGGPRSISLRRDGRLRGRHRGIGRAG